MTTESTQSGEQPDSGIGRPRLLQRVHEAIRVRHYSRRTEEAYVHWIKRYIFFNGTRPPRIRVMECLRLRVKDLDLSYRQVLVRDGKGAKDRVTMLPAA
jgi:integrase